MLAEGAPGEHRDTGLLQQPVRELIRLDRNLGDVREGVEGAPRRPARDPWQLVEAGNDELAARLADWAPPPPRYSDGVFAKYAALVSSASEGAVTRAGS